MEFENGTPPAEVAKLAKAVGKCWDGGSITIRAVYDGGCWNILVHPAVREIHGGEHDGGQMFSRFVLKLDKLVRVFDKPPHVLFDSAIGSMVPLVHMRGTIDREDYAITVLSVPPPDTEPTEIYYTQGPKRGKVEPKIPV